MKKNNYFPYSAKRKKRNKISSNDMLLSHRTEEYLSSEMVLHALDGK